jgi:sortase A
VADRRSVDDLTIEELERILIVKRRAARPERLRRLAATGRRADDLPLPSAEATPTTKPLPAQPSSRRESAPTRFRSAEVKPSKPEGQKRSHDWSRLRDRVLLILEVASLAGLILVLVSSVLNLRLLNQEMVQAREGPASPPTPLIDVAVLPGGHAPPTNSGEIPEHMRKLVQPLPAIPISTPGPRAATRIVIPAIGIDAPVVAGDDPESLKKGAGHHIGSANPGERGNCFISAHNDVFGEIFRDLGELELEDKITLYAGEQPYHYSVKAKRIVEPTDVSVMHPTTEPVLTLMTCYPYLIDTHRLVVIAELVK